MDLAIHDAPPWSYSGLVRTRGNFDRKSSRIHGRHPQAKVIPTHWSGTDCALDQTSAHTTKAGGQSGTSTSQKRLFHLYFSEATKGMRGRTTNRDWWGIRCVKAFVRASLRWARSPAQTDSSSKKRAIVGDTQPYPSVGSSGVSDKAAAG